MLSSHLDTLLNNSLRTRPTTNQVLFVIKFSITYSPNESQRFGLGFQQQRIEPFEITFTTHIFTSQTVGEIIFLFKLLNLTTTLFSVNIHHTSALLTGTMRIYRLHLLRPGYMIFAFGKPGIPNTTCCPCTVLFLPLFLLIYN